MSCTEQEFAAMMKNSEAIAVDQTNGGATYTATYTTIDGRDMVGTYSGSETGHVSIDTRPTVITLPYPPSANRYWRNYNGRMVKSAEARSYFSECQMEAFVMDRGDPTIKDVAVVIRVYRPQRSGDLDNRLKVVLDALQGIAYVDDKQIVEIHAFRYDDKDSPRVEIEVRAV